MYLVKNIASGIGSLSELVVDVKQASGDYNLYTPQPDVKVFLTGVWMTCSSIVSAVNGPDFEIRDNSGNPLIERVDWTSYTVQDGRYRFMDVKGTDLIMPTNGDDLVLHIFTSASADVFDVCFRFFGFQMK